METWELAFTRKRGSIISFIEDYRESIVLMDELNKEENQRA